MKNIFKQPESSNLYQPRVLMIRTEKKLFKTIQSVYPLDSKEVFITPTEATDFLPIFLNRLVKEKILDPAKLFLNDNMLNEDYVKTAVVTLTITRLEFDHP